MESMLRMWHNHVAFLTTKFIAFEGNSSSKAPCTDFEVPLVVRNPKLLGSSLMGEASIFCWAFSLLGLRMICLFCLFLHSCTDSAFPYVWAGLEDLVHLVVLLAIFGSPVLGSGISPTCACIAHEFVLQNVYQDSVDSGRVHQRRSNLKGCSARLLGEQRPNCSFFNRLIKPGVFTLILLSFIFSYSKEKLHTDLLVSENRNRFCRVQAHHISADCQLPFGTCSQRFQAKRKKSVF